MDGYVFYDGGTLIHEAVRNGTVLPEHSRIIDMDKLAISPIDITDLPQSECLMVYMPEDLNDATILPARKDGETDGKNKGMYE